MQLFLKMLSGMVNSVDPDQTAPSGAVWPGSALFAYDILSETLCAWNFRTITIVSGFCRIYQAQPQTFSDKYIFSDYSNAHAWFGFAFKDLNGLR